MNKKIEAIIMIKVLVIASIYFPILLGLSNISYAQVSGNACCQKTKDDNTCEYTNKDNCDPNFKSAFTTCENTNYCQVGCCFTSNEGQCFTNAPRTLCEEKDGTFSNDPSCNSVPQCQLGCCSIGNENAFTTLTQCKNVVSKFPGVELNFDANIRTEVECLQLARTKEKGCCVAGDSCVFTTRDSCNAVQEINGTGFFKDTFCSNDKLTCECAPKQQKGCLPNEDDVYWFDSCGNPENIAQECDYASGTLCGFDDKKQDYSCLDTSCTNTFSNEASPDSGGIKKSGESWCVYDAGTGFGNDPVGSRHYRFSCVNGKEFVEPCRDFREELCISSKNTFTSFSDNPNDDRDNPFNPGAGTLTQGACRDNRFEDCSICKTESCCNSKDLRDCFWLPPLSFGEEGACVPHVPPGFKFWQGEGTDVCSAGNIECEVQYAKQGLGGWECVGNCQCLSQTWLADANSQCKSFGDCGAYFNINGDLTLDGFSSSSGKLTAQDVGDFTRLAKGGAARGDASLQTFWGATTAGLIVAGITSAYGSFGVTGATYQTGLFSGFNGLAGLTKDLGAGLKTFWSSEGLKSGAEAGTNQFFEFENYKQAVAKLGTERISLTAGEILSKGNVYSFSQNALQKQIGGEISKEALNKAGLEIVDEGANEVLVKVVGEGNVFLEAEAAQVGTTGFAQVLTAINTVMWIYTIYQLINYFFQDEKTETITVSCETWVAPKGGNNCELCNERGILGCSEYECKSYGQACGILNPGTEEEKCTFISSNDVSSPIIQPLDDVLKQPYKTQRTANGYRIAPNIKPFDKITIGIKMNEPSQCKIDNAINKKYDDMQSFFGSALYLTEHKVTFNIPAEATQELALEVTNGGKYNFYVRCQDANGNQNEADYNIQFEVDKGPDLTSPSIETTSIFSGSYIANDVSEVKLSIFTNEPSECKWDLTDKSVDAMINAFECANSGFKQAVNNFYECKTTLTNIKPVIDNNFFFRCKDLQGNAMQQGFEYTLLGTIPLTITSIEPKGEQVYNPILKVKTEGGALRDGSAVCGFGLTNNADEMITFFNTGQSLHEQQLFVQDGIYTYFITCIDQAGNIAQGETTFSALTDSNAPIITRIFQDKKLAQTVLHITTNEPSTCEYSTVGEFVLGQGAPMPEVNSINHEAVWGATAYYIICKDQFDNIAPLSIIYI